MNLSIYQALSLAAYGNSYLSGKKHENYFPDNIAFRYCNLVKFVDPEESNGRWTEV